MSKNQCSEELKNYSVPPYKEPKIKLVAIILSFFHLVFICIPIFLIVYVGVDIAFFVRDSIRYVKKTIKYAKAKFKSEPTEGVS